MSKNTHILLVEDDSSLRITLRTCLETEGYQCVEAKDGYEAHDWLDGGYPVDLVVTDHQMPRITGLELIKGLKSQKNTEAIPIIFYSDQLTADLNAQALQAGATRVLEKPFLLKDFLDLVAQVCEKATE